MSTQSTVAMLVSLVCIGAMTPAMLDPSRLYLATGRSKLRYLWRVLREWRAAETRDLVFVLGLAGLIGVLIVQALLS